MRNVWTKVGVPGSVSTAFGSLLWSQKKTETAQTGSALAYHLLLASLNSFKSCSDSYRANILTRGMYPGQLTTVGMQQLYELGEKLRKRSIHDTDFINPNFSPTEVYVRSTNIVRTIEFLPSVWENLQLCVGPLFHIPVGQHKRQTTGHNLRAQQEAVPLPTTPLRSAVSRLCGFLTCNGHRTLLTSPWSCINTGTPKRPSSKCPTGKDQLILGCRGVYCPRQEYKQAGLL
uniref:Uncharacterized protein n=1 Tax=Salmo trutta TaxID=8032 RepID=A0A673YI08_SALTR